MVRGAEGAGEGGQSSALETAVTLESWSEGNVTSESADGIWGMLYFGG
jgi:hypothetical protein